MASSTGCPAMLATGIYVWQGGNLVPAECDALRNERVVVLMRDRVAMVWLPMSAFSSAAQAQAALDFMRARIYAAGAARAV